MEETSCVPFLDSEGRLLALVPKDSLVEEALKQVKLDSGSAGALYLACRLYYTRSIA